MLDFVFIGNKQNVEGSVVEFLWLSPASNVSVEPAAVHIVCDRISQFGDTYFHSRCELNRVRKCPNNALHYLVLRMWPRCFTARHRATRIPFPTQFLWPR